MQENQDRTSRIDILVIYHSQNGKTRQMAEAVAGGAAKIEGVRVSLKQAVEATLEDLVECDALAIGSPEYFGYMAGMIKDFFDRTYDQAKGKKEVFKKPYLAFISAGNDGTGALMQIERICLGYPLKKVQEPVIAVGPLNDEILAACAELGQTLAAGVDAGIF